MSMSSGSDRCAGCGRPSSEVGPLQGARAPGTKLAICDACVEECVTVMADVPTRIPGGTRPCAFCKKPEDQVAVMLVLGSLGAHLICDECVDAFRRKR